MSSFIKNKINTLSPEEQKIAWSIYYSLKICDLARIQQCIRFGYTINCINITQLVFKILIVRILILTSRFKRLKPYAIDKSFRYVLFNNGAMIVRS